MRLRQVLLLCSDFQQKYGKSWEDIFRSHFLGNSIVINICCYTLLQSIWKTMNRWKHIVYYMKHRFYETLWHDCAFECTRCNSEPGSWYRRMDCFLDRLHYRTVYSVFHWTQCIVNEQNAVNNNISFYDAPEYCINIPFAVRRQIAIVNKVIIQNAGIRIVVFSSLFGEQRTLCCSFACGPFNSVKFRTLNKM